MQDTMELYKDIQSYVLSKRKNMSTRKVSNVNVIADARSVARIIIRSKNLKFAKTARSLHNPRKQVFRLLLKTAANSLRIVAGSKKD